MDTINTKDLEISEDEHSDIGLQIVLESPRILKKTRKPRPTLNETEKEIVATVENDLEANIQQKATKTNLTTNNIKHILKHVATDEGVLALLRRSENPSETIPMQFEPKCTRAKTKHLLTDQLPWVKPQPRSPSAVQQLFTDELSDDSSDEYLPDSPRVKKRPKSAANDSTIAVRTRSKLCLSHTPLEAIEEAFIPPDITTDMYDMDCDDDEWRDFLKTFAKPLEEVVKACEDEEHDPEYNILADEAIDEVDKEELRADKAVTVSRKELNSLMAELFEYADIYESNRCQGRPEATQTPEFVPPAAEGQEEAPAVATMPVIVLGMLPYAPRIEMHGGEVDEEEGGFKMAQREVLAQQMRQHVQMLAQNYLLTYENPEFGCLAAGFKQKLVSFEQRAEGKELSYFRAINLEPALRLVEYWENLFKVHSKQVMEIKMHVQKVLVESREAKLAGNEYIVTFPPFLMETFLNTPAFIYPNLLPRIPFRSHEAIRNIRYYFTYSENQLLAIYLERLISKYKNDKFVIKKNGTIKKKFITETIQSEYFSHVSLKKLESHIILRKRSNAEDNPIKYYYLHQKAPPTTHYVIAVDKLEPLRNKNIDLFPYQWKEYLQKQQNTFTKGNCVTLTKQAIVISPEVTVVSSTKNLDIEIYSHYEKAILPGRRILPKGGLPSPHILSGPRLRKRRSYSPRQTYQKIVEEALIDEVESTLKKSEIKDLNARRTENFPIFVCPNQIGAKGSNVVTLSPDLDMMRDMPNLGLTPLKNIENDAENTEQTLTFKNVTACGHQYYNPAIADQIKKNLESIAEFSSNEAEKDNPEDINELMKASATVKTTKKEPSGAEKKRAKLRREFVANLAMASPDDNETEKQRQESFAGAYYDKLSSNLTKDDWTTILEIFQNYDYKKSEFVDFYKKVEAVLDPKYPDLAEEFLLFLTKIQALKIGKLMPYLRMNNIQLFLRKLQAYFWDQPSQLKKIMKTLTDLSIEDKIGTQEVKAQVLPLLKGNNALTDLFLQVFPDEKPPNFGPSETVFLNKELSRLPGEEVYETVVLPDDPDPYGGPNCICTCHNVENNQFKTRNQHCTKCSLKFIHGKVFVQNGKSLRPAVVSFLTNTKKDHKKRLNATQRKRCDSSPSKQNSKEVSSHNDELRLSNNESEDDCEGVTKKKRKRSCRRKIIGKKDICDEPKKSKKQSTKKRLPKKTSESETDIKEAVESKQSCFEIEYNEPPELLESESEFFESSQEMSSDSSSSSGASTKRRKSYSWSRDEDRTILESFELGKSNEETFKVIAETLKNRSINEIKNRFHKLMSLLQEMAVNQ